MENHSAIAEKPRLYPTTRQLGWWRVYAGLILFLIADIVVQVFLAGAGIFASGEYLVWHGYHSWLLDLVTFLLLLIGFGARLPRPLNWLGAVLFGLVFSQAALIHASRDFRAPLASAFHPVFALFIFVLAFFLRSRVQQLIRAQRTEVGL
ncbi:hypothetical protein EPA93_04915 [Ktedonosporobacter rubrisoli]|uniref:Uncharacterized protein n=1 Tax=Ktedonosporobacter rubrisoli TaxID=2509675 RepID=A0A4P6JJQ6_KTERU|nr:DUF6220 domain-containing protein [Ktedonosporobacter rubrisoli]QBD75377.1 hypothetical protein EPA93_04915 [Ktedonosporobacter rubrisoli]